ncbi:HBR093Cp [Eremothecium sinecaudum]|uniref:HBR093Cp n=1 Tax=Eremothecium sinecaudum TaxID=45286 RepID=A0A120K138_9SACH|nr:HBR093Cp [Eremothecium sinecaudum]AMD18994.1 HBR093Cp [Eremothecium sinecaudum]
MITIGVLNKIVTPKCHIRCWFGPSGSRVAGERFYSLLPPKSKLHSRTADEHLSGGNNFLVLKPQQTGMLNPRPTPSYFKNVPQKLSVLHGVEMETSYQIPHSGAKNTKKRKSGQKSFDVLEEIESQRATLMVYKSSVSKEQVMKSIYDLKPADSALEMSKKRYEQLRNSLTEAYSVQQLNQYCKKYYHYSPRIPKKQLVTLILDEFWQCKVNESIEETEDLIVEHVIDIQKRDMHLLLMTDNGKILQNLARLGATITVAVVENKLVVRATKPIIRYVEVSIAKILENIKSEIISLIDFRKEYCDVNSEHKVLSLSELTTLIQKEGGVYFEELVNENRKGIFKVSALAERKLLNSKNLLLWAMDYKPQTTQDRLLYRMHHNAIYTKYPVSNKEWFDWTTKSKMWYRIQTEEPRGSFKVPDSPSSPSDITLPDQILTTIYDFIMKVEPSSVAKVKNAFNPFKGISISLGQVLTNSSDSKYIFQPQMQKFSSDIEKLPLYHGLEDDNDLFAVDHHDYLVQLKFVPKLSAFDFKFNIPPIELWFSLDDFDNIRKETIRCVLHNEERSFLLQTPDIPFDYKITMDKTSELIPLEQADILQWIKTYQPGLNDYLDNLTIKFGALMGKKLVLPPEMSIKLELEDGTSATVDYQFITMYHRRVLNLKYKDKYLVHHNTVNGGKLGGSYEQLYFACEELPEENDLKQFIIDVMEVS